MSHYSKIFSKIPVDIPNRSGFDLSHENCLSLKVGSLVPCMCSEVLPNDTVNLGVSSQIQLPPMASDFFGRVEGRFEAFFVPNRVLFGGWQEFMTSLPNDPSSPTELRAASLPSGEFPRSAFYPGSLGDYLNAKFLRSGSTNSITLPNILPFLAYHKIVDDWYIDSRVQKSAFQVPYSASTATNVSYCPYVKNGVGYSLADMSLGNGLKLWDLRQRNYQRDYFTNCTPRPQSGNDSVVGLSLSVSGSSATGGFSIAQLRAANSLQQWMERNNIAGFRYGDQIKAQFGVYPTDAVTDRSVYLGSHRVMVYNKSVYQSNDSSSSSSQNPFSSVGSKYSSPLGVGNGSLIDNFTCKEHGFIFVMFSICPSSYYDTGVHRMFKRSKIGDFAFPLLSGVGDQAVFMSEIDSGRANGVYQTTHQLDDPTFGYTQRYAEMKYMNDEVHGLLCSDQSLSPFALKRSFISGSTRIGTSFIQVMQDALDDVSAVEDSVSDYGAWADIFFSFKKISTLPAYSIPTLGDMKDTHVEVIDSGGKML